MNEQEEFGRVRINRDGLDPETKNLPYPAHSVVAVLSSEEAALRAVERLKAQGVPVEESDLFMGEQGEAWLHNYHHRSGLLGRLRQIAESLGSDQLQSQEYEAALKQGYVVLVVRASQEDTVPKIQQALTREGASRMRYYGVLSIRDLE